MLGLDIVNVSILLLTKVFEPQVIVIVYMDLCYILFIHFEYANIYSGVRLLASRVLQRKTC